MLSLSCWALGNTSLKLPGSVVIGEASGVNWVALETLEDAAVSEGPLPRATGLGPDVTGLVGGSEVFAERFAAVVLAELPGGGLPGLVLGGAGGEGGGGAVVLPETLVLGPPMIGLPRGGLTIIGGPLGAWAAGGIGAEVILNTVLVVRGPSPREGALCGFALRSVLTGSCA
jgi:hypothetical protein